MDLDLRRKPDPDFVIRLVARDLRPWVVPMRNLSRVMDAVQRLVDQRDDEDPTAAIVPTNNGTEFRSEQERVLHLLDVKSGSAAYRVSLPKPAVALRLITETGAAIAEPDKGTWTQPTLSSLKELSEVAASLGCSIELRLPGDHGRQFGDVLATIGPKTFERIESSAYITGDTSIFATIERVGGATEMHCGIRVAAQPRKMVICLVDGEELVRKLGQFIYQDLVLIGRAVWLRHNHELKTIFIHSLEPPKSGSMQYTLRRIHDAGGSVWDSIADPDAEIAGLRGA